MAEYTFTIPGRLPGWNEYTDKERSNKYAAATLKKDTEEYISLYLIQQLRGAKIKPPVTIKYLWVEPNRRRDKDNIAGAKKFFQDSLVKTGFLKNDGWQDIKDFSDSFEVDKQNPRVEVRIMECEP